MAVLISKPTTAVEGPVAVKQYCDRWTQVFRSLAAETKNLSEILVKWMAYDQSTQQPANGSKWTKEEEELLKQALLSYGHDMDKICETLPLRTEQAIRAAVKRKMDPVMVQQIGPLKRRNKRFAEDNSPLASYFNSTLQESETSGGDGTEAGVSRPRTSPEKTANSDKQKTGWFYEEAGVELNDHDFLAILEDDPSIMEGAMSFTGIPPAPTFKIPDDPLALLQEKPSTGQDFIFLHNYKMPLLELAKELNVFKPKTEPVAPPAPEPVEQTSAVEPAPSEAQNTETPADLPASVETLHKPPISTVLDGLVAGSDYHSDFTTRKSHDFTGSDYYEMSDQPGDVITEETSASADLELAAALDQIC